VLRKPHRQVVHVAAVPAAHAPREPLVVRNPCSAQNLALSGLLLLELLLVLFLIHGHLRLLVPELRPGTASAVPLLTGILFLAIFVCCHAAVLSQALLHLSCQRLGRRLLINVMPTALRVLPLFSLVTNLRSASALVSLAADAHLALLLKVLILLLRGGELLA
jgi:hypothetical protein